MSRARSVPWLRRTTFEDLVGRALDTLPETLAQHLENIAIVVEEEPDPTVLAEFEMGPEEELMGLYQGVPLTERGSFYEALPDRIAIYRGPILRCCTNRHQVVQEIRDTVVHELGHYFGLEDEDMPY